MTEKEEALSHHLDSPLQETRVPKNTQDHAECVLSPKFGTAKVTPEDSHSVQLLMEETFGSRRTRA